MSTTLALPDPDLRAVTTGESIVAFASRTAVDIGDEVTLLSAGSRPADELLPAYRDWADLGPPPEPWTAVVDAIHPAALLDPATGAARHVLSVTPAGDLLVLRVYGPDGPVLSDTAFAARLRSLEGALR